MLLNAVIKDEHASDDSLQSDSSFLLRNSMMTYTTSSLIIERISSDKASNLPKRDVRFILLK